MFRVGPGRISGGVLAERLLGNGGESILGVVGRLTTATIFHVCFVVRNINMFRKTKMAKHAIESVNASSDPDAGSL